MLLPSSIEITEIITTADGIKLSDKFENVSIRDKMAKDIIVNK